MTSESPVIDLTTLVKAYDVRGTFPDQFSVPVAHALGAAFAEIVVVPEAGDRRPAMVIGNDMRPSGPELVEAFAAGAAERGVDVTLIGLCSTDGLYHASGVLDLPGAMFTASHNPAEYNGIKLCRAGARPVGEATGLVDVRRRAERILEEGGRAASASAPADAPSSAGVVTRREMLADYAAFLRVSASHPTNRETVSLAGTRSEALPS